MRGNRRCDRGRFGDNCRDNFSFDRLRLRCWRGRYRFARFAAGNIDDNRRRFSGSGFCNGDLDCGFIQLWCDKCGRSRQFGFRFVAFAVTTATPAKMARQTTTAITTLATIATLFGRFDIFAIDHDDVGIVDHTGFRRGCYRHRAGNGGGSDISHWRLTGLLLLAHCHPFGAGLARTTLFTRLAFFARLTLFAWRAFFTRLLRRCLLTRLPFTTRLTLFAWLAFFARLPFALTIRLRLLLATVIGLLFTILVAILVSILLTALFATLALLITAFTTTVAALITLTTTIAAVTAFTTVVLPAITAITALVAIALIATTAFLFFYRFASTEQRIPYPTQKTWFGYHGDRRRSRLCRLWCRS